MKKCAIKIIVFLVVIPFLFSCATVPNRNMEKETRNSAEREIIKQAVVAGAVVGATAGAGIGAVADKNNIGRGVALGAISGAMVGAVIGKMVAKYQLDKLRNIQLQNEQLTKLLNSAQEYNLEVETYNNDLRNQIAELNATEPEHRQIAQQKKQEAEQYLAKVREMIQERTTLSETLVPEQKAEYQRTLEELKNKDEELLVAISELDRISGTAIIGS